MFFSRAFVMVYDLIILVNAVFIGLDEENPMIANSEWVFLALYILEILLKLYVFEPRVFFSKHSFWNWWEQVYNIIMSLMCFWHFVFTHQRFWIPSTDLSTDSLRYILTGVHVESEIQTLHSTIYSWVWSSFFSEADGLKKQKKSTVQIKTNSVIQVCLLNTQKPYVDIYKLTCTVFVCYVKCLIS